MAKTGEPATKNRRRDMQLAWESVKSHEGYSDGIHLTTWVGEPSASELLREMGQSFKSLD